MNTHSAVTGTGTTLDEAVTQASQGRQEGPRWVTASATVTEGPTVQWSVTAYYPRGQA